MYCGFYDETQNCFEMLSTENDTPQCMHSSNICPNTDTVIAGIRMEWLSRFFVC